ncbi:MAG: hypothetical protein PHS54_03895 [Clostridia bacterium]|nr:hypothetical protein [Clostridia bacterium]
MVNYKRQSATKTKHDKKGVNMMEKGNIIDPRRSIINYKTSKFKNYELKYDKYNVPYLEGTNFIKNETISVDDSAFFNRLIEFSNFFKDGKLIFVINLFEKHLENTKLEKWKTNNQEQFNVKDSIVIGDIYLFARDKYFDGKNFPFAATYSAIAIKLQMFFEKYGIPDSLKDNALNKINLNLVIKKLDDLYSFIMKIKSLEHSYSDIEVPLSKIGVTKEKDEFVITNYFDCPFEYTKYILLINEIIGDRDLMECKRCHSILISNRKDKLFCSPSCRSLYSRERKNNKK